MAVKFATDEYYGSKSDLNKLVSKANKRIRRGLKAGNEFMRESSAFKRLDIQRGMAQFSVKGKSGRELDREVKQLLEFLNDETSLVNGYKNSLKTLANKLGLKTKNKPREIQQAIRNTFALKDEISEILDALDRSAHVINYNMITDAITGFARENKINLDDISNNKDKIVDAVTNMLRYEKVANGYEGYSENGSSYEWIKSEFIIFDD